MNLFLIIISENKYFYLLTYITFYLGICICFYFDKELFSCNILLCPVVLFYLFYCSYYSCDTYFFLYCIYIYTSFIMNKICIYRKRSHLNCKPSAVQIQTVQIWASRNSVSSAGARQRAADSRPAHVPCGTIERINVIGLTVSEDPDH